MLEYLIHLSIIIGIFSILAIALNPVVVTLGSMNIANAALFGVGAYASAFVSTHITTELPVILILASALSAIFAMSLGLVSYSLRDDEFAVFTLLLQLGFVVVLSNLDWLGANRGLLNLSPFQIAGYVVDSKLKFMAMTLALLGISILTTTVLFGAHRKVLAMAVSEDQVLFESLGLSALRLRLGIYTVSGCGAGLGGVLYAHYFTFLEPQIFSLTESFFVILAVSLVGRYGIASPIMGAIGMVAFPELLRFLGLHSTHSGSFIQIIFACLLFITMALRASAKPATVQNSASES